MAAQVSEGSALPRQAVQGIASGILFQVMRQKA